MDQFNILCVANSDYFDLALVFLNSLRCNANNEAIRAIYVGDTGLTRMQRRAICRVSAKVKVLETGLVLDGGKRQHSKQWLRAVTEKTRLLHRLTEANGEDALPLVLMDADLVILKDFTTLIDSRFDIQVCRRAIPSERSDITMKWIGCFFVVHNSSGVEFVKNRIDRIEARVAEGTDPPFETPALCETIESTRGSLSLGEVNEEVVACNNKYVEGVTRVIHLKSEVPRRTRKLIDARLQGFTDLPKSQILAFRYHTPFGLLVHGAERKVAESMQNWRERLHRLRARLT